MPRSRQVSRKRKVSKRGTKKTVTRKRSVSKRGTKKTVTRKRSVSKRGNKKTVTRKRSVSKRGKKRKQRSTTKSTKYSEHYCKSLLSDKIYLYMKAHKYEGKFANPGHAKSAAYAQVLKENPQCRPYF